MHTLNFSDYLCSLLGILGGVILQLEESTGPFDPFDEGACIFQCGGGVMLLLLLDE
jgi:hypothetical protein